MTSRNPNSQMEATGCSGCRTFKLRAAISSEPSRASLNAGKAPTPGGRGEAPGMEGQLWASGRGWGSGPGLSLRSPGPCGPHPAAHQADPPPPCSLSPCSLVLSDALKPRCTWGSRTEKRVQRGLGRPGSLHLKHLGGSEADQSPPEALVPETPWRANPDRD